MSAHLDAPHRCVQLSATTPTSVGRNKDAWTSSWQLSGDWMGEQHIHLGGVCPGIQRVRQQDVRRWGQHDATGRVRAPPTKGWSSDHPDATRHQNNRADECNKTYLNWELNREVNSTINSSWIQQWFPVQQTYTISIDNVFDQHFTL